MPESRHDSLRTFCIAVLTGTFAAFGICYGAFGALWLYDPPPPRGQLRCGNGHEADQIVFVLGGLFGAVASVLAGLILEAILRRLLPGAGPEGQGCPPPLGSKSGSPHRSES